MRTCHICGTEIFHHHKYCEKHYPKKSGEIAQLKNENKRLRKKIEGLERKHTRCKNKEYYINIIKSLNGTIKKMQDKKKEVTVEYTPTAKVA